MKPGLCSTLLFALLVGESWCQRTRDRPSAQHRPQQHQHNQQQQRQPQQDPQDDGDLTDECPEPNGFFADGYQCDKYYECKDGAITEKLCPDGMVFNDYSTLYEKCDLPFNIDCSQRSQLQDPKPSTHCRRQNGYFAHEDPKVCDKFYFCVDGKFNMITCPSGLVYNEKTGICTWPDEAKKKHCSSEAEEGNRIKRVAIWKSEEDTSKEPDSSSEDVGSEDYSSRETEHESTTKDSSEYGSNDYSDYPQDFPTSGEADSSYELPTPTFIDPEFDNFDADFDEFADGSSDGFPELGLEGFVRRKKDNRGDMDGYIKGYVSTIGRSPKRGKGIRSALRSSQSVSPSASSKSKMKIRLPKKLKNTKVFKFECPKVDEMRAQQHPRYPDPEDCQFFYVCINGEVPRRNGCKIGQVFNEATGSCDWPRNVPECKEWYKGVLTDEELEALEHPKPKVRNNNYTTAAQKRKRPHQSVQYDLQ